jgi:mono/diheme cytochrome c family protein
MRPENLPFSTWLIAASVLIGGCDGLPSERSKGPSALSEQPLPVEVAKPVQDSPATSAQTLFTSRCAVCHGLVGLGDGPAAVALTPKPRAFADAAWQRAATDDVIYKTILGGGPAMGKSAGMPPNPDLADKPELVKALVAIVRGFNKG